MRKINNDNLVLWLAHKVIRHEDRGLTYAHDSGVVSIKYPHGADLHHVSIEEWIETMETPTHSDLIQIKSWSIPVCSFIPAEELVHSLHSCGFQIEETAGFSYRGFPDPKTHYLHEIKGTRYQVMPPANYRIGPVLKIFSPG